MGQWICKRVRIKVLGNSFAIRKLWCQFGITSLSRMLQLVPGLHMKWKWASFQIICEFLLRHHGHVLPLPLLQYNFPQKSKWRSRWDNFLSFLTWWNPSDFFFSPTNNLLLPFPCFQSSFECQVSGIFLALFSFLLIRHCLLFSVQD